MRLAVKGWAQFQHYKNRCPPWIRLHRSLLDNRDFQRLPVASRALAPMLWLLASESLDGTISADADDLSFRLRQSEQEIGEALKPLIDKGFFAVVEFDAINTLADCLHDAEPEERRGETETEGEEIAPAASPPGQKLKTKTQMPEGFGISERVSVWAAGKGYGQLAEHLDAFKRKASAKAYTYANWDDAFMEAIREDWAKLRGRTTNGAAPPGETVTNPGIATTAAYLAQQASIKVTPPPLEALNRVRQSIKSEAA